MEINKSVKLLQNLIGNGEKFKIINLTASNKFQKNSGLIVNKN